MTQVQVLLYGGQVISWKNEQGDELLFKSSKVSITYSAYEVDLWLMHISRMSDKMLLKFEKSHWKIFSTVFSLPRRGRSFFFL